MRLTDLHFPDGRSLATVADLRELLRIGMAYNQKHERLLAHAGKGTASMLDLPLPSGMPLGDATVSDLEAAMQWDAEMASLHLYLTRLIKRVVRGEQITPDAQLLADVALDARTPKGTRAKASAAPERRVDHLPLAMLDVVLPDAEATH